MISNLLKVTEPVQAVLAVSFWLLSAAVSSSPFPVLRGKSQVLVPLQPDSQSRRPWVEGEGSGVCIGSIRGVETQ